MSTIGIRTRTTAVVVVAVAAVWCVAAILTWFEAEHEAAEIFDGHLAQAASMLITQTAMEIEEPEELDDELHAPLTHRYARKVAFQLWSREGRLLVHSENAPNVPLGTVREGFSDSEVEGVRWRVYSAWNNGRGILVQVGERADARSHMADEVAEGLLKPLLWGLPLLTVLLWLVIGRAIRPLGLVANEIAARSPSRLDPLEGLAVPREVEPLVRRLDELLVRVDQALQAEQRFTGDAAHELRTPIAALGAQAEVALAASDDAEKRRALVAVLAAARRMGRLVEQLLTLARADSQVAGDWAEVDLVAIAREVIADAVSAGSADTVEIELDAPERLMVAGEPGWLAVLLRNLVENALRFSPDGELVTVSVTRGADGAVVLEVRDRGPGVAPEDLPRLGERFWREARQAGSGSGLGLSIARRVATLHGATLDFGAGEDGSGLVVSLRFPARR
ncbi:MAG: sensor histidine kinase N-terminal domain-containing protein [Rhodocyclaceae bacterium]|nr:sensor histidine kinase N-terminal domain-containing protein [Rhodocyclaceae bacterium]